MDIKAETLFIVDEFSSGNRSRTVRFVYSGASRYADDTKRNRTRLADITILHSLAEVYVTEWAGTFRKLMA